MRPIHHHQAERVKAHVLLCLLAYYVEWHMRRALAPLVFDEEDHQAAQTQRSSIVAPGTTLPIGAKESTQQANRRRVPSLATPITLVISPNTAAALNILPSTPTGGTSGLIFSRAGYCKVLTGQITDWSSGDSDFISQNIGPVSGNPTTFL